MNVSLQDKVIVITGGARGIGKFTTEKLLEEGAKVVVLYNQSEKEAIEIKGKNRERVIIEKCDVSNYNEVEKCYSRILKQIDRIDVLINNAGIGNDEFLVLMSEENWKKVLECNLNGTFYCCKCFLKIMLYQGYGKIINIASLKGQEGSPQQSNYSASKAGIIALTRSLAKEVGGNNISVNAICPGFIETDLNRNYPVKKRKAIEKSVLKIDYCLRDYINFLIFLLSDEINGISGQVFNLDSRIL